MYVQIIKKFVHQDTQMAIYTLSFTSVYFLKDIKSEIVQNHYLYYSCKTIQKLL